MKKRRGFFLAASVLAFAVAIASACSFPEPTLVDPVTEGGSSSGGDSEPTADGTVFEDASLVDNIFAIDGNQNVDPDGGGQEASVAPEAGLVDATGCDPCDCDDDDAKSEAGACGAGGTDCNDLDPFIPHDGFVASKPNGHSGDWNCDGVVTKQFPVNLNCGLLANCSAAGFSGDPPCGAGGMFVRCKNIALPLPGVLCEVGSTETVVQACK